MDASLLGIPQEMRLKILQYLPAKDVRNLRLVCKELQQEVDCCIGVQTPVSFSHGFGEGAILNFLSGTFIRDLELNPIMCSSLLYTHFNQILPQPHKMESLRLISCWLWIQFLEHVLYQCCRLKRLDIVTTLKSMGSSEFSEMIKHWNVDRAESESQIRLDLPLLQDLRVIVLAHKSYPELPFRLLGRIRTGSSLKTLDFRYELLQVKASSVANLMEYSWLDFLSRNGRNLEVLKLALSLELEISGSKPEGNNQFEDRVREMFRSAPKNTLHNLKKFRLEMETYEGYGRLLKFIGERIQSLEDFGLRVFGSLRLRQEVWPLLRTNCSKTLKKLYLFFGEKKTGNINASDRDLNLDFRMLAECPNLEEIVLQGNMGAEFLTISVTNLGPGVLFLRRLRVLVIDGFKVERDDLEYLTERMRRPGVCEHLQVVGIVKLYHESEENSIGISVQSIRDLLSNRRLEAVLIDLYSVLFGSMLEFEAIMGFAVQVTGQYRNRILELRDSSAEQFPYWKTSLLGFCVQYPM